jgi:hypothetical protein
MAANKAGLSPWTGKPKISKPSIVIGRNMNNRVNPAAKDLGAKTISPEWNEHFRNRQVHYEEGLNFNKIWIEIQIEQQVKIYDIGGDRFSSGNYDMELNTIQNYNYQNVSPAYYIHYKQTVRIIYCYP